MPRKPKTKKVLVLLASPRKKRNSIALAERIIKGAVTAGATIERVYLHGQNIAPCNACQKPEASRLLSENKENQSLFWRDGRLGKCGR
jgi:hypothetical protein